MHKSPRRSWPGLGSNFGVSTSNNKQSYVARYTQRYYSIDIDLPQNPSDFFQEGQYPTLASNVAPVYVSSVSYGRMVLFNMSSKSIASEIEAAVNAALSVQDRLNIEANLSITHRTALSETDISSYVTGGSSNVCSGVSNIESVVDCIRNGGGIYQEAVPLAYTLRFLHNNEVARVVLSSTYTARQCDLQSGTATQDIGFQIVSMKSSGHEDHIWAGARPETFGKIGLRPTAESEGNKGNCAWNRGATPNPLAGTDMADVYHRDNVLIFDRARGSRLHVGSAAVDVSNLNFVATVTLNHSAMPPMNNLSICGALADFDSTHLGIGGGDDYFGSRTVINPAAIQQGRAKTVRIGTGQHWVEIELQRRAPTGG